MRSAESSASTDPALSITLAEPWSPNRLLIPRGTADDCRDPVERPYDRSTPKSIKEETPLRISRVKAKNLKEGDKIVMTVSRVMGMQGRKPANGAPLLKLEYDDGSTETFREDDVVDVLRA